MTWSDVRRSSAQNRCSNAHSKIANQTRSTEIPCQTISKVPLKEINELNLIFLVLKLCIKDDPLERFCVSVCLTAAGESARIIPAAGGRLKLDPLALPRALYKTHQRVLKSDVFFSAVVHRRESPLSMFNML